MSGLDKILISDMMGGFVNEAPPTPFVSYCVVCKVFLTLDEMLYEKGHVFHKDCFESHGKDFPDVNHALNSINSNAKVQLVQLKNLKIRKLGGNVQKNSAAKPKVKTKRKTVKNRSSTKRKKTKKQSKKKRMSRKKRTSSKRSRSTRKTRSRVSRRPARRRTSKKKTRRRR